MTRVGVRELRQRASELLRLVERGETIEITDRGRPVALLTPVPQGRALERMRAGGEIEAATGDVNDLPAPRRRHPEARGHRSVDRTRSDHPLDALASHGRYSIEVGVVVQDRQVVGLSGGGDQ